MAFFAGDKKYRSKADGPPAEKERGNPRDLRLEKNSARRAACQLRASKAGRSWKGRARERADGVFFCRRQKKDAGAKRTAPWPRRNGEPPRPPIGEECCPQGGLLTASQQSGSQLERRSKGACGWRLFCRRQKKDAGAKRTAPWPRRNGGNPETSDWKRMPPAGRPANCEPAKRVAVGKEEQGSVRMASFFAIGRKKTPEQSGRSPRPRRNGGNSETSDWRRMPPAGRPANCEPAKWVAVGKEEQGSVRMASFLPQAEKRRRSKADFAPTWCRRWDSNPHGIATNGF